MLVKFNFFSNVNLIKVFVVVTMPIVLLAFLLIGNVNIAQVVNAATDAPTLTLVEDTGSSDSDRVTNNDVIKVSGVTSDASNSFTVAIGGTPFATVTARDTFTLGEGTYSSSDTVVTVTVTDSSGTSPATTLDPKVVVDKTLPATPTLALSSDTGSSDTDGITSNGQIDVTKLEGGTTTWEYSTDGGSSWNPGTGSSFTLPEGTYAADTVQVKQTDLAGNVSAVGKLVAVTVDTTKPNAPTLALNSDTGISDTDTITNNGQIDVDLEGGTTTWQYSVNSGSSWADGSGSSFTLTTEITYDANTVRAQQTDLAGNVSDEGQLATAVTLDTTAPAAPTGLSLNSDTGTSSTDFITSNGQIDVAGVDSNKQQIALRSDQVTTDVPSYSVGVNGGNRAANIAALIDGITSNDVDYHPSSANGKHITFTLDQSYPNIEIKIYNRNTTHDEVAARINNTVIKTFLAGTEVGSHTITGATTANLILEFSTTALGIGGDQLVDEVKLVFADENINLRELEIFSTEFGPYEYRTDSSADWTAGKASSFTLAEGTYNANTVQARNIDTAGNPSTPANLASAITVDTTPPAAPTIALNQDTGSSGTDKVTTNGQVDVTGLETGAPWQYSTDNGVTWVDGSGTSFTLSEGVHAGVQARQSDLAGAWSDPADIGSVTVDTAVPPAPSISYNDIGLDNSDRITSDKDITVGNLNSDGQWEYSIDGGTTWVDGSGSSFTLTTDGTYAAGNIKARQTSLAGLDSTESSLDVAITVDTVAPSAPSISITDTGSSDSDGITNDNTVEVTDIDPNTVVEISSDGGATWSINKINLITNGLATASTTNTAYSNLNSLFNGNIGADFNYHPENSDGQSITVVSAEKYTAGEFVFYNRQLCCQNRIQGSTVEFFNDDQLLETFTFDSTNSDAGPTSFALSNKLAEFNKVVLTFSGTPQNMRRIDILAAGSNTIDLSDGTYAADTFKARTVDIAGNVSPDTAGATLSEQYVVDTQVATLSLSYTDNGISPLDAIISNPTVAIANAEDGATLEYTINGGTTWIVPSAPDSFDLPEGSHIPTNVKAKQTDLAGNIAPESSLSGLTIEVDTTPPAAPTISLVDNGASSSDGITSDYTIAVSGMESLGSIQWWGVARNIVSSLTNVVLTGVMKTDVTGIFDGVTNTYKDYKTTGADGQTLTMNFSSDHKEGSLHFYNTLENADKEAINGSTLTFYKDSEVVEEFIFNDAREDTDGILPFTLTDRDAAFNKITITFSGATQSMREIKVYGKPVSESGQWAYAQDDIKWELVASNLAESLSFEANKIADTTVTTTVDSVSTLANLFNGQIDPIAEWLMFHPVTADGNNVTFDFASKHIDVLFKIYNRRDCCSNRIDNSVITFLNDGQLVGSHTVTNAASATDNIYLVNSPAGQEFNRLVITFSGSTQNIHEFEIYASLREFKIQDGNYEDILVRQMDVAGNFSPNVQLGRSVHVETNAPELTNFAVSGSEVTLTFNEALSTANADAIRLFNEDSSQIKVSTITTSGNTAVLSLEEAPSGSLRLVLGINSVQDVAGNGNDSVFNSIANAVLSFNDANLVSDDSIIMSFNLPVEEISAIKALHGASFNGATVSDVRVYGSNIELTFASAIPAEPSSFSVTTQNTLRSVGSSSSIASGTSFPVSDIRNSGYTPSAEKPNLLLSKDGINKVSINSGTNANLILPNSENRVGSNGLDVIFDENNFNEARVQLEPNTAISGNGESGMLNAANHVVGNGDCPVVFGSGINGLSCLDFGSYFDSLSLSIPVKITLSNSAGQNPYFTRSGETSVNPITSACEDSNLDGVVSAAEVSTQFGGNPAECFFNDGSDLVIFSNHLTIFGAFENDSFGGSLFVLPTIDPERGTIQLLPATGSFNPWILVGFAVTMFAILAVGIYTVRARR